VDPLDEAVEEELVEEGPEAEREELERKERLKLSLNLTGIPVFSLPRYALISSLDVLTSSLDVDVKSVGSRNSRILIFADEIVG